MIRYIKGKQFTLILSVPVDGWLSRFPELYILGYDVRLRPSSYCTCTSLWVIGEWCVIVYYDILPFPQHGNTNTTFTHSFHYRNGTGIPIALMLLAYQSYDYMIRNKRVHFHLLFQTATKKIFILLCMRTVCLLSESLFKYHFLDMFHLMTYVQSSHTLCALKIQMG